jgi:predicted P-loop ATPase
LQRAALSLGGEQPGAMKSHWRTDPNGTKKLSGTACRRARGRDRRSRSVADVPPARFKNASTMTEAVKVRTFASDAEFEAWIHADIRGVAEGKSGNEAFALVEAEQRNYDLDPIRERYRQAKAAKPKKILGGAQPQVGQALVAQPQGVAAALTREALLKALAAAMPGTRWRLTAGPKGELVPEQVVDETQSSGVVPFATSKSPKGIPTTYINAKIALERLALECRYDVFHDRLTVHGFECSGSGDATENLDNVALKVRDVILREFEFDPGKNHILDAIVSRALDRTYDPVKDYLDGLEWDGESRIDTWLVDWCGVADTRLNREIGRKMLLAAVRRVREPGVKFDSIVVLEGPQGSGRSTMLKILAGGEDNFSDTAIIGSRAKEMQEQIQGVWIYELAEMDGLDKVDLNRMKNFASQTVDRARPAYGRSRIDRRRRCIFVGTTNDKEYLRDDTGNRRFWSLTVPEGWLIDLEGFREVRDQLWAEAVLAEAAVDFHGRKEPLVISPDLWNAAAIEAAKRTISDPWDDILATLVVGKVPGCVDGSQADAMGDPEWRVATADLLAEVLDIDKSKQYPQHSLRLAKVMRRLGWVKPDAAFKIKGKNQNGYRRLKTKSAAERPLAPAVRRL